MIKTRVAILFVSVMSLLLTACNEGNSINSAGNNPNDMQQKQAAINHNSRFNSSHPMTVPGTGPIIYVALGDSTGAGVGAQNGGYVARIFKRIEAKRPESVLTNLCVSGATTRDVLSDQLDRGIARQPTLITLGIGINDIGHGVSLEQFSKNYQEILGNLRNKTRAAIVVTNIPDISTAPRIPPAMRSEYHQLILAFNQKLEESASRYGATMFDVYTITHEQLPSHPEFFSGDGFHPSDKGYEFWAERMWPTIAQTIGVDVADKP